MTISRRETVVTHRATTGAPATRGASSAHTCTCPRPLRPWRDSETRCAPRCTHAARATAAVKCRALGELHLDDQPSHHRRRSAARSRSAGESQPPPCCPHVSSRPPRIATPPPRASIACRARVASRPARARPGASAWLRPVVEHRVAAAAAAAPRAVGARGLASSAGSTLVLMRHSCTCASPQPLRDSCSGAAAFRPFGCCGLQNVEAEQFELVGRRVGAEVDAAARGSPAAAAVAAARAGSARSPADAAESCASRRRTSRRARLRRRHGAAGIGRGRGRGPAPAADRPSRSGSAVGCASALDPHMLDARLPVVGALARAHRHDGGCKLS